MATGRDDDPFFAALTLLGLAPPIFADKDVARRATPVLVGLSIATLSAFLSRSIRQTGGLIGVFIHHSQL